MRSTRWGTRSSSIRSRSATREHRSVSSISVGPDRAARTAAPTAIGCGGDDCDDADANRFPGNSEVCDARDHDEDCDPTTFGVRDQDEDGYPDSACCNIDGSSVSVCGTDCDDSAGTVHPTEAEACDGRDNDCNGLVDDGIGETWCSTGPVVEEPAGTFRCPPPAPPLLPPFPSWDYDCDGDESREPRFASTCDETCSGGGCLCFSDPDPEVATCGEGPRNAGPVYGAGTTPECGEDLPFRVCHGCPNSCSLAILSDRALRCR